MRINLRAPWATTAALAVVCALLAGVLIARPATATTSGARPELRISVDQSRTAAVDYSQGTPTAVVSYTDGTRGDAYRALAGPWTPDRPVTMVVVVAQSACAIDVDGVRVVEDGAAVNRLAVCVWRAP